MEKQLINDVISEFTLHSWSVDSDGAGIAEVIFKSDYDKWFELHNKYTRIGIRRYFYRVGGHAYKLKRYVKHNNTRAVMKVLKSCRYDRLIGEVFDVKVDACIVFHDSVKWYAPKDHVWHNLTWFRSNNGVLFNDVGLDPERTCVIWLNKSFLATVDAMFPSDVVYDCYYRAEGDDEFELFKLHGPVMTDYQRALSDPFTVIALVDVSGAWPVKQRDDGSYLFVKPIWSAKMADEAAGMPVEQCLIRRGQIVGVS